MCPSQCASRVQVSALVARPERHAGPAAAHPEPDRHVLALRRSGTLPRYTSQDQPTPSLIRRLEASVCGAGSTCAQYLALVIDKWMAYRVLDARSIVLWTLDPDRAELVARYRRAPSRRKCLGRRCVSDAAPTRRAATRTVSATLWEILYAALDKVIERASIVRTRWEADPQSTRLSSLLDTADRDVHTIFLTVAEVRRSMPWLLRRHVGAHAWLLPFAASAPRSPALHRPVQGPH